VTGRWSYIDKTRNRQAPLPLPNTPLLLLCATQLHIGLHFGCKATRHLSITREGEGAGQGCRAHLSTAAAKLRHLFNFHLLFYYDMAEAPSSTFNPRACRLLQLQSSLPTSSLFNFDPACQLHPSSPPTSTLVAIQIPNPVIVLFPPLLLDGRGVLDAAAAI
jgi:hypothetical protein